jgi:hypothetical protein
MVVAAARVPDFCCDALAPVQLAVSEPVISRSPCRALPATSQRGTFRRPGLPDRAVVRRHRLAEEENCGGLLLARVRDRFLLVPRPEWQKIRIVRHQKSS